MMFLKYLHCIRSQTNKSRWLNSNIKFELAHITCKYQHLCEYTANNHNKPTYYATECTNVFSPSIHLPPSLSKST